MQKLIDNLAKEIHGITLTEAKEKGICIDCKKPIKELKISKEYEVSGLCCDCFKGAFK